MSETKTGFVAKIFTKEGTSARGAWYAKSFKIAAPDGTEDPFFYQLGFNTECPFNEGDYIQFDAEPKDDRAQTVVKGSGSKPKNPPQRTATKSSGGGGGGRSYGGGGGGGAKVKHSDLFGDIGGYNTEDDIRRMSYSAARGDAVSLVGMLLEHDALPMSGAKGKAGQPKRFEAVTEMVDKLTVEFFYDSATGRKLETVADAGTVNVDADAQLPDAEAEPEAEAEPAGGEAPPADDGDEDGSF